MWSWLLVFTAVWGIWTYLICRHPDIDAFYSRSVHAHIDGEAPSEIHPEDSPNPERF